MKIKKLQKGFTLIELMITVAIIGILAAIALPQYRYHMVKSRVAACLQEMNAGKTNYEVKINENIGFSLTSASDLGLKAGACDGISVTGDTSIASITGAIKSNGEPIGSSTGDQSVILNRNDDGFWSCNTTVYNKYAPKGCSGIADNDELGEAVASNGGGDGSGAAGGSVGGEVVVISAPAPEFP